MRTVREIEARQVAPLVAARQRADDARGRDSRRRQRCHGARDDRTERVDAAIRSTMDRVDETADRVRSSVSSRVNRVLDARAHRHARRSTGSFELELGRATA